MVIIAAMFYAILFLVIAILIELITKNKNRNSIILKVIKIALLLPWNVLFLYAAIMNISVYDFQISALIAFVFYLLVYILIAMFIVINKISGRKTPKYLVIIGMINPFASFLILWLTGIVLENI